MSNVDNIVDLIKILKSDNSELIKFIYDVVERKVLNYINHDILPVELYEDVKMIVISCYKEIDKFIKGEQQNSDLKKVKRGDTEYNYESVKLQIYDMLATNNFFGYKVSLNIFRKLRK